MNLNASISKPIDNQSDFLASLILIYLIFIYLQLFYCHR